MKKIILTTLLLTSLSFAKTDKQANYKCYMEMLTFFQGLKTYVGSDINIYLDVAKMMKQDGYSCREIMDFFKRKKDK